MDIKSQSFTSFCTGRERDYVTVIIKVVDYCNFECAFCRYYLDQDRQRNSLSIDTFKQVLLKASEYNISRGINHLTVIFHGGEPLLWGFDNFRDAIHFEKDFERTHNGFSFVNNIQTNGSLIDDKWAEFFKSNNFSIGISIDGPNEINFHKNSQIQDDVVLNNIKRLSRHGCKYGILTVITEKHSKYPDDYYNFLVDNEIHSVGFCYCFDQDEKDFVSNEALSTFLTSFFQRYFFGNYKLHVREFEFVIKRCLGVKVVGCTFDFRRSCGNYFSVRPNGDICFCDSYSLDDVSLGNIHESSFEDIKQNPRLREIVVSARISALNTCKSCEIQEICGGGCARHVLTNGRHAFCDTYKIIYPHINQIVKERRVNQ